MRIKVKGQDFHVDENLGGILIAAGLAEEVKPEVSKPKHGRMVWRVAELLHSSRVAISGACPACHQDFSYYGNQPAQEAFWFHCGSRDAPTQEIIDEYFAARKRRPEIVDAVQDYLNRQRRGLEAAGQRQNETGGVTEYDKADPGSL